MSSLEARLKKLEAGKGTTAGKQEDPYFKQFRGMGFEEFWEAIGKPVKNGQEHGYYPYEAEITKALETHKYVWIKKATGLGITEYFLRYMSWLALKDDTYRGSLFCIVTGPRQDLAEDLMERIQYFFATPPQHTKTEVILNGVKIQAFPSNHLDSMRGQPNVKFILLDEADFFRKGEQDNARDVSERYIAKSDPTIAMVSTPNIPGGLYQRMETEGFGIYHPLYLPYTKGLGNIYSEEDIRKARESKSFEREYNLQYGYGIGDAFSPADLDWSQSQPPYEVDRNAPKSMGIDPGYGSSTFAIVITQLAGNQIQVIHSEATKNAYPDDIRDKIISLFAEHNVTRMYVDGAKPDVIRSLKRILGERTDYLPAIEGYRKQKVDYQRMMKVVPVNFGQEDYQMLDWVEGLVSKHRIVINKERHAELLTELRMAKQEEDGSLDKSQHTMDLTDALLLSCKFYRPRNEFRA